MSKIPNKSFDILGTVLLIGLMFITIVYGTGYCNQIYEDEVNYDLATRTITHFMPLFLTIIELIFALLLLYNAVK